MSCWREVTEAENEQGIRYGLRWITEDVQRFLDHRGRPTFPNLNLIQPQPTKQDKHRRQTFYEVGCTWIDVCVTVQTASEARSQNMEINLLQNMWSMS